MSISSLIIAAKKKIEKEKIDIICKKPIYFDSLTALPRQFHP